MKEQPNFLLIMVDEERFPPVYESKEVKKWRKNYLKAHEFLKQHGMSFTRHYVGSTACSPSRATLFTGQYLPCTELRKRKVSQRSHKILICFGCSLIPSQRWEIILSRLGIKPFIKENGIFLMRTS